MMKIKHVLVNSKFIKNAFPNVSFEISQIGLYRIHELYDVGVKRTHVFFDLEWIKIEFPQLMRIRVSDIDRVVEAEYPLIAGSNLFSPVWYVEGTGQTTASCRCPLIDFIKKGVFLGRSPHPLLTGTEPVETSEHDALWENPEKYFLIQRHDSMLHAKSLDWLYGESTSFASALSSFTKYQNEDFHDGRWWFNPETVLGEISVELSDLERFARVLQKVVDRDIP